MKKNNLKIFDWLNILLLIITISTFMCILIFLIISIKKPHDEHIVNLCNIFIGIFTGFFVSTIIRINDMAKQKSRATQSFNVIKPQLNKLKAQIENFYPHFKHFVKINQDNTIDAYTNRIFFINLSNDNCLYDFIDLDEEFINAKIKYIQLLKNFSKFLYLKIVHIIYNV